ncbi:MAG: OmpA family protein [Bacteroidetes bacterium]|nr:OmpA family protein [Bacteroidota bacterium]MCL1968664.1 OmpA family protein [Bacteroidota bacterium]
MKKQLLLIGLILGMFTAFSQEVTKNDNTKRDAAQVDTTATVADFYCPHRILLRLGGGYSNDIFKKDNDALIDVQKKFTYAAMFEVGYAYLWQRKVNIGIGIGVGIGHTRPLVQFSDKRTDNVNDPGYNPDDPNAIYALSYSANGLKLRQRVWAVEVPLTMQLEKKFGNQKNGIYFGFGVKGYFPFSANLHFPGGEIDLDAIYDPELNLYMDKLNVHLDDFKLDKYGIKPKMRCSIDILGELGGIFGISRSTDFYVGAYATYGFLNVYPKDKIDLSGLNVEDPRLSQVADKYVNYKDKWNLFQVGLKLGFHFKPCKECGNKEYRKDHQRRYWDEMMKKKNEPIIITNTVQEYYYIVPSIAQELLDDAANDPGKKKALLDLAQSLSNIKILFPLDKDTPILDDNKRDNIRRASELLKANPDLKVIVTGYTSPEGTKEHNKDLGHRRAIAVRQKFIDNGVPADQIAVQNYTAEDPQLKQDIPETDYKEQRAVIFKIEKK